MTANAVFHDVVCRLYTHKCNFIYTFRKEWLSLHQFSCNPKMVRFHTRQTM